MDRLGLGDGSMSMSIYRWMDVHTYRLLKIYFINCRLNHGKYSPTTAINLSNNKNKPVKDVHKHEETSFVTVFLEWNSYWNYCDKKSDL